MEYYCNNYHRYYLYSTGTSLKPKYYDTRLDAEKAMNKYCVKNGIVIECTENDKHFKKYSNHKGVRFYINRV